jgi:hypothetical protein
MTDSHAIDRATRIHPIAALERHERPGRGTVEQPVAAPAEAAPFDGIPATIPDGVLAEVQGAMDRLDDLHAAGGAVRFHAGEGTGARIELVGADGRGRQIGAGELFRIVDGAPVDPAPTPADAATGGRIDREA